MNISYIPSVEPTLDIFKKNTIVSFIERYLSDYIVLKHFIILRRY